MRLIVGCFLVLLAALPAAAAPQVLILNSYHPGYDWSDNEQEGILQVLGASVPNPSAVVEYLDSKHFPDLRHRREYLALLQRKYAASPPALVFVLDNPALEFMLDHRAELPPVPVIFCGVNNYTPGLLRGDKNITGIAQVDDPVGTIRAAAALQPGLREMRVVTDTTITGLGILHTLVAGQAAIPTDITWLVLRPEPLAKMASGLAGTPPEAALLLLSFAVDPSGGVYNSRVPAQLLSAACPVPVYAIHGERLGHGIVGGMLLDGKRHGAAAAELGLRVMRGEPAGSIPVDTQPRAVPMFDGEQLRRFNLDPARLPAGSIIINQPRSLWRERPRAMAMLTAVFAALCLTVALLTLNIIRRRRAEKELRSLDELKTNLLANVSHELRTPLVAIRGYSELIGEGISGPVNELQGEQIGVMIRNIDRLLELIDNLLDFSRLEHGVMRLRRQNCDLRELARDAAQTAQPRARRAQLTLHTQLPSQPVTVYGDSAKLLQIMNNLIDNAIKFTSPDGKITVAVSAEGSRARLTVSDTGIGLTPEAQVKIFERFYQVDGGPTRRRGGTGLGLSIVREIARLHEGSARVNSTPGAGTTFIVELPLA